LKDVEASTRVPRWKLIAFRPVDLRPGQEKTLRFKLSPQDLAFINENGQSQIEPGTFCLRVGGCSPHSRQPDSNFIEMSFELLASSSAIQTTHSDLDAHAKTS
jgi:hypothetical protein